MVANLQDVTDSFGNLNLTGATPQNHGQESHSSANNIRASLQDVIHSLNQVSNIITLQKRNIKAVAKDPVSSGILPITEVCSLLESTRKLEDTTESLTGTIHALNELVEDSVLARLRLLGNPSTKIDYEWETPVQELFSHFDKQIRTIIRQVLSTSSAEDALWKVSEECYKQSYSGILHAPEETSVKSPYDHDLEDDEYYDHKNPFAEFGYYTKRSWAETERRDLARRQREQIWIDFWAKVLSNSPNGPTLFYPPISPNNQSLKFENIPRYLFRTFDKGSSGMSNERVIASKASIFETPGQHRNDLLAL